MLGGASEVESIDFSAYTAGTGNAGTTILSATVGGDGLIVNADIYVMDVKRNG